MIAIPERYNYIACFLTFACNFRCSYCINRDSDLVKGRRHLSGMQWVELFKRLDIGDRKDLPITLGGGEPSMHPDFFYILQHTPENIAIDILTNLNFDLQCFVNEVSPERLNRGAPYADIRVSFHPSEMAFEELLQRVLFLVDNGFRVGVWAIIAPENRAEMEKYRSIAENNGIDFRLKDLLGWFDGRLYGEYKYPSGVSRKRGLPVSCRTSELLIDPSGDVFRCHRDLYAAENSQGNITENKFYVKDEFTSCELFGFCNPCDLKMKFNRFQQEGHCSVEISLNERD